MGSSSQNLMIDLWWVFVCWLYHIWWQYFGQHSRFMTVVTVQYNPPPKEDNSVRIGRKGSSFMHACSQGSRHKYICVCVGGQLLHVFMASWSNGCSDQARHSSPCSILMHKQRMCVPLTQIYDIKVPGDHTIGSTLSISVSIWHLLVMQSVEWVVSSEHSCSSADTAKAILLPWHFCVDHFGPNVRKGGTYFR